MTLRLFKLVTVLAGLVAGGILAATRSFPSMLADTPSIDARRDPAGGMGKKRRLLRIAKLFTVFLVIMAIGGFLVATSGIIPIKASSGHWAITRWFLQFSKQRSVATQTIGLDAPLLEESGLVLKGAGHYEIGCRPCHGSPEMRHPRIAQAMTPHPPYLPQTISKWERDELFYIVKHGIKFTGMPAWPAQGRDDEVWAMVAFLRRFPSLDATEYRRMVNGEVAPDGKVVPMQGLSVSEAPPRVVIESCGRCHGMDGLGRGPDAFPRLAGQHLTYLDLSLQAYARGQRHSGIMEPIAAGLRQEEVRELARYYASLPKPPPAVQAEAAVERGRSIAQQGIPNQRVPACTACHGPGDIPRNQNYPLLAGQYTDYLVLQLELFKQEKRGGTAYAHIMRQAAAGLNAGQMRDVARYYSSLDSALDTEAPHR
jgi:cytochrome c553